VLRCTTAAATATTKKSQRTTKSYLDTSYSFQDSNTQKSKFDVWKPAGQTMVQVIDDEFNTVNVIKLFPQDIALNIFGFTDPLLALKHFRINCEKYSLVISDIGMPSMNGYEFVRQKKIDPKVIIMSTFEFEDIEFLNVLPKLKIDAFVQKPFSNFKLYNIIERYLRLITLAKMILDRPDTNRSQNTSRKE
jgi:DNA-binding response OmpR family regulator